MMKKIFVLISMLATLAVISGCVNFDAGSVRGRGETETREIQAENFSGLRLSGIYEFTFRQSSEFSVILSMQENLFNYFEPSVEDGVLNMDFTRGITVVRQDYTPVLQITAPYLDSLLISGTVDADIYQYAEILEISVSGTADILLSGSADTLNISIAGAANVNAFDMTATDVSVRVRGVGNVEVYATDTLYVNMSGVGNVRYDGNPEITRNITGPGRIERQN